MQPLMITPEMQCRQDSDHLRILAIFHFVLAALAAIAIGLLAMHYAILDSVLTHPEIWKQLQQGPKPPTREAFKNLLDVLAWVYTFIGGISLVYVMLNFLSGIFLIQRKFRTFSLITAALDCLLFPIGPILGVFTIIVLSRPSVRTEYDELANPAMRSF